MSRWSRHWCWPERARIEERRISEQNVDQQEDDDEQDAIAMRENTYTLSDILAS